MNISSTMINDNSNSIPYERIKNDEIKKEEEEEKEVVKQLQQEHQQQEANDVESPIPIESFIEQAIPINKVIQPECWPPRNTQIINYDWSLPTYEIYKSRSSNNIVSSLALLTSAVASENGSATHANTTCSTNVDTTQMQKLICDVCVKDYEHDTKGMLHNECKNDDNHDDDHDNTATSSSSLTSSSSSFKLFTSTFCEARSKLDYTYHTHVVKNRQYLQDAILKRIVSLPIINSMENSATTRSSSDDMNRCNDESQNICNSNNNTNTTSRPWIVFTAGPMGVGKGYVITQLQQQNLLNIRDYFITIDPDLIKYELPEMVGYLQIDRTTAATKLHRESTQMADIIFEYAIQHSLSILVDGSLRDVLYYKSLFHRIRTDYKQYRIAIIHITASRDVIYERAMNRAQRTGRVVPIELIEESIIQVPQSVHELSSLADAVHVIANNPNQPIQLVSSTIHKYKNNNSNQDEIKEIITTTSWDAFAQSWELPITSTSITVKKSTKIKNNISSSSLSSIHEDHKKNSYNNIDTKESELDVVPVSSFVDDTKSSDTTRIVSDSSSASSVSQHMNHKVLKSTISMSKFFDNPECQSVANTIWQKSYPNFCARCALVTDEQCGICIHNKHICACSICRPSNMQQHCSNGN
jgi:hypothetical protein